MASENAGVAHLLSRIKTVPLYVPDADLIKVVNRELIQKLGLDKDAINPFLNCFYYCFQRSFAFLFPDS